MFSVPLKFSLCQMLTSRPTEYFSVSDIVRHCGKTIIDHSVGLSCFLFLRQDMDTFDN